MILEVMACFKEEAKKISFLPENTSGRILFLP